MIHKWLIPYAGIGAIILLFTIAFWDIEQSAWEEYKRDYRNKN
jgi:hypothetical protein